MATTWLYVHGTGRPHAYSTDGTNFYLAPPAASGWWAWLEDGWLYAARGGQPLGWFAQKYFYDVKTHSPLYYSG